MNIVYADDEKKIKDIEVSVIYGDLRNIATDHDVDDNISFVRNTLIGLPLQYISSFPSYIERCRSENLDNYISENRSIMDKISIFQTIQTSYRISEIKQILNEYHNYENTINRINEKYAEFNYVANDVIAYHQMQIISQFIIVDISNIIMGYICEWEFLYN